MELVKHSDLKPASFENSRKSPLGVKIICDLLSRSISNGTNVTRADITNAYLDYKFNSTNVIWIYEGAWRPNPKNSTEKIWGRWGREVGREEYGKMYKVTALSLIWFKQNLGTAILHGKLLAIPVINI